jgi:hypothetical protein
LHEPFCHPALHLIVRDGSPSSHIHQPLLDLIGEVQVVDDIRDRGIIG